MKDRETFNKLMLRYRGLLYSVCRRYRRDGLEVDDLLQESMLALWNLREKLFDITSPPKQAVWIWRVARSRCIDLQRSTPPPSPIPDDYDISSDDTTLHNDLQELVNHLPEPDRTIVHLHFEGYNYKEIGHHVNMTKNNVGIRLMRIKEKLKQQWNTPL